MTRVCLLVEDQPANRDWLTAVLAETFPQVQVVHAPNLREARAWLDGGARGLWLALIDLGLPDGSGVTLIRDVKLAAPTAMVVVATIYDDDTHLFDALAAGAHGYLLKDEDRAAMTHFLRRIETGDPPLSPSIARRLLKHFHRSEVEAPAPDNEVVLTGRETETLTLLARGLTIAEVAKALNLKPQTVAGYVKVIYQKLNVSSRAEATLKAVKRGLA
ncbi:bacterial regulatory protein, luxR family protein [Asticcacaulis biprosthecium C19]|uniref:Bacterial regulatory protein, luxR family protein n=1 Tax=Asticcacaulis biprosthecium C19 TaxID=715226 RepID=F4QM50_9CAUL|nr:response regulator transcription factor [Asticcacaulis biprosthecium]EGF93622.1 bacterial regulatory protein, luxR family protein [Asticcacaulis biprosthecium C19]